MASEGFQETVKALRDGELKAAGWTSPDGRYIVLKSQRHRKSGIWLGLRGTIVTPNDGAGVAQSGRLVRR